MLPDYEKHQKVNVKGQIVIPGELRREYGIEPGSYVTVRPLGEQSFEVRVAANPAKELSGMMQDIFPPAQEVKDAIRREEAGFEA